MHLIALIILDKVTFINEATAKLKRKLSITHALYANHIHMTSDNIDTEKVSVKNCSTRKLKLTSRSKFSPLRRRSKTFRICYNENTFNIRHDKHNKDIKL